MKILARQIQENDLVKLRGKWTRVHEIEKTFGVSFYAESVRSRVKMQARQEVKAHRAFGKCCEYKFLSDLYWERVGDFDHLRGDIECAREAQALEYEALSEFVEYDVADCDCLLCRIEADLKHAHRCVSCEKRGA